MEAVDESKVEEAVDESKVEIKQVEIKLFGCSGKHHIVGAEGLFLNRHGRARTFPRASRATAFLRRTGYPWIVKMPSGRTVYINCTDPEIAEKLRPHSWGKKDLTTIVDRNGVYDIWRYDMSGRLD